MGKLPSLLLLCGKLTEMLPQMGQIPKPHIILHLFQQINHHIVVILAFPVDIRHINPHIRLVKTILHKNLYFLIGICHIEIGCNRTGNSHIAFFIHMISHESMDMLSQHRIIHLYLVIKKEKRTGGTQIQIMEWKLQFSGQFHLKILCMLFKKVCGSLYQDHLTDLLPPGNIQSSHSFRLNILSACIQIFLEIKLLHKILILLHQYFCLLLLINGNKRLVDHIIKF